MSTTPPGGFPPPPTAPAATGTPSAEAVRPRRRPFAITLASLLMVPTVVTWLVAGIAFFRAMLRTEGDGKFLVVIIGVFVLGIALIVVLMGVSGILMAWRGTSADLLANTAVFTFGLFVVVIVVLLVQGKLSFAPTMVTPLVVGALAGVALALLNVPSARAWCPSRKS